MPMARNTRLGTIRAHLIAGIAAVALLGVGVGGWAATTEFAGAVVAPGVVVVPTPTSRRSNTRRAASSASCSSTTATS